MSLKSYEPKPYTIYIVRCTFTRGSKKQVYDRATAAEDEEAALLEAAKNVQTDLFDLVTYEVVGRKEYNRK